MKPLFFVKRSLLRTILLIIVPVIIVAAAVYYEALKENESLIKAQILFIAILFTQTLHILTRFQKTMTIHSDRIEFTYTLFRKKEVTYFKQIRNITIMGGSGQFGYWWLWRIHFHKRGYASMPLRGSFTTKDQKEATKLLYELADENEFYIEQFVLTKNSSGRAKSARN